MVSELLWFAISALVVDAASTSSWWFECSIFDLKVRFCCSWTDLSVNPCKAAFGVDFYGVEQQRSCEGFNNGGSPKSISYDFFSGDCRSTPVYKSLLIVSICIPSNSRAVSTSQYSFYCYEIPLPCSYSCSPLCHYSFTLEELSYVGITNHQSYWFSRVYGIYWWIYFCTVCFNSWINIWWYTWAVCVKFWFSCLKLNWLSRKRLDNKKH